LGKRRGKGEARDSKKRETEMERGEGSRKETPAKCSFCIFHGRRTIELAPLREERKRRKKGRGRAAGLIGLGE